MGEWFSGVWNKIAEAFSEFISVSGLKLLVAALVLLVGVIMIRLIFKGITKRMRKKKTVSALSTFLISIGRFVSYVVLFLIILAVLGIPTDSLIVILGSVSIAIGLSMQGTLANFFSGIMLLMTKPFKIGDYIEVGEKAGTVKSIGILNTSLITPDNKLVVISNGDVTQNAIINFNYHKTRRLEIKFYTYVSASPDKVKDAVIKVLISHPNVIKETSLFEQKEPDNIPEITENVQGKKKRKKKKLDFKKLKLELSEDTDPNTSDVPTVRLIEFSPGFLTFTARVWVQTGVYWSTHFDLCEQIQTALIENNIEVPKTNINIGK